MKYAMLLFNILQALASIITTHILQLLYSILASKKGTCPGIIPIFLGIGNLSEICLFYNLVF